MAIKEMVGEFLAAAVRQGRSPLTITTYRGHLESLSRFLDCRPPTLKLLRAWIDDRHRRGYAASSILGAVIVCKAFFTWSQREGLIEASPAAGLERPKLPKRLPKSLQPHIVARLLDAAGVGLSPERDRALILFMLETGVRRTAAARLTLDRLDMASGCAKVVEKGNIERVVYFSAETRAAIGAWLAIRSSAVIRRKSRECLFGLSSWTIYRKLVEMASEAHLPHVTPHMLRHTCATLRVMQNCDASTLQQIMGWGDIRMAMRYTQFNPDQLRQRTIETSPLHLVRT